MSTPNATIELTVSEGSPSPTSKGPWAEQTILSVERRLEDVRGALADEIKKLNTIFSALEVSVGSFSCTELELSLEATMSGGFRWIASGEAGLGATVTLKFSRTNDNNEHTT